MWPWGPGPGSFGWLFGLLSAAFWILLIVVAVLLLRREVPNIRRGSRPAALDLLEERYARGEISREEFLERRSVLLQQHAGWPPPGGPSGPPPAGPSIPPGPPPRPGGPPFTGAEPPPPPAPPAWRAGEPHVSTRHAEPQPPAPPTPGPPLPRPPAPPEPPEPPPSEQATTPEPSAPPPEEPAITPEPSAAPPEEPATTPEPSEPPPEEPADDQTTASIWDRPAGRGDATQPLPKERPERP